MRNYIKFFLWGILLLWPSIVFGAVTCSNGSVIELDKSELKLDEVANIKITSDYEYETTYVAEDNKIVKISNEGIITPLSSGTTKVSVLVKFNEAEGTTSNCTGDFEIKVLSNDSSLKLLNLEEYDISDKFNSKTYEYVVTLPYNYEKINIIAEASSSDAEIIGDGRRYLNEGQNEYEVIVKATDGSSSTYKIIINREDANDDATLKNLIVEGYILSPKFSSDIDEYTINVDKDVEKINISAEANYEFAKVLGTGEYPLATGSNSFYITVTAENGEENKYKLLVEKSKGNSKLSSLEVDGYKLDKKFNSDEFIYNVTVNNDIDKLNIVAEATDNDKVEIIGNEDLQEGENNIIIRVSNDDKGATTYKIIVNKLSLEEEEIRDRNNDLLKILLVIFIIAIVIMATAIIIFLKKNYKNKKKIKNLKLKKQNKKK